MSFILEALKRAERSRKPGRQGRLPYLTAHTDRERKRRLWPWVLVGGALFVNAAVVAVVLRPKGAPPAPPPAPVAAAATGATTAPALAPTPLPAAPPRAAPAAPPRAAPAAPPRAAPDLSGAIGRAAPGVPPEEAGGGSVRQPAPERASAPVQPRQLPAESRPVAVQPLPMVQPVPSPPPTSPVAAEAPAPKETSPVRPPPAVSPQPPAPVQAAAPTPARVLTTLPAVAPRQAAVERPAPAEIRRSATEELSSDERAALPRLELNAHVYADDPGQRFVFINGQSYRTGQRVGGSGGPVVKEITPEGAVIDYGHGIVRLKTEP